MQPFIQHFPIPIAEQNIESLDRQRIYDQQILQDNIIVVLDEITNKAFLDGFLLESVDVGTSETLVEHKLGRTIRGYQIVRKNGPGDVYDNIDNTAADLTKYLPLIAGTAVTISLIVF